MHWNGKSPETSKTKLIRRTETCGELDLRIHNLIEREGVSQNTNFIFLIFNAARESKLPEWIVGSKGHTGQTFPKLL